MISLLHESGSRVNAWRIRGAVCAHAGPVPPRVVSPSPLEDYQLLAPAPPYALRRTTMRSPLPTPSAACVPCFTIPKRADGTLSRGLVQ
jgi:hypothetical protein